MNENAAGGDAGLPGERGARMSFRNSRRGFLAGGAVLLLLVLAVYSPAIRGGYIWDDDEYVTHNSNLASADGLRRIWLEPRSNPQYYPLVFSSFWVERHLWGLNPLGYHLVNVLLHALNAILLWHLLRRLSLSGAWLAAAIFALHPVHVESVAWITERKNVLSAALYLGAAVSYLRFAGGTQAAEKTAEAPARRRFAYALALALFGGALLAKSITASLPAALLLVAWWRRGRIGWGDVAPLLPLFLMGAVFGLHTAYLEKNHVGALGPDWDFTALQRCLIAGRVPWFYAGKLLWPDPLIFFYPRWQVDAAELRNYFFPLGAVALVALLWTRRRQGRGALTAVLFFIGTLVPVSGFFNFFPMRFSFVADHFQYLASIGPIALFCGALGRRLSSPPPRRAGFLAPVAAAALLLVLATLSWRQCRTYASEETLWRTTLAQNPGAFIAHDNLGVLLDKQGHLLEAKSHFEQVLKIKPDFANTYFNLGAVLGKLGNADGARAVYAEALRLRPLYAEAHNNLGILYATRGELAAARYHFEMALRIKPGLAVTHRNLGIVLGKLGLQAEAETHFQQARTLPSDDSGQR